MKEAKKVFEAVMRGQGYDESDFLMEANKYAKPSIQTRWRYFLIGWEMAVTTQKL